MAKLRADGRLERALGVAMHVGDTRVSLLLNQKESQGLMISRALLIEARERALNLTHKMCRALIEP